MSTTVTYKGSTLATLTNQTKTLETSGTWLEDDITITDSSSGGNGAVIISDTTDSHGGTIRTLTTTNSVSLQTKTITPTSSAQTVNPDTGYDGFSSVTVNAAGTGYTIDDIATANVTGAITIPSATSITAYGFYGYTGITSLSAPNVTTIHACAFNGCTGMTSISLPKGSASGNYDSAIFQNCTGLTVLALPGWTRVLYTNTFNGCTNLATIDIGSSSGNIGNSQVFLNCSSLTTLILRKSSVITLGNVGVFNGTPFASGGAGGTIYVPNALISSYQTATNWSTLYGYGTVTFTKIEGSQYENYYADGTAIS